MGKISNWMQRTRKNYFQFRDWASGEDAAFAIGDATTEEDIKDGINMVAFATSINKTEWRFVALDLVLMSLIELYGREHILGVVDAVRGYDEVKDVEFNDETGELE